MYNFQSVHLYYKINHLLLVSTLPGHPHASQIIKFKINKHAVQLERQCFLCRVFRYC
jgi:hypothetical protein